MSWSDVENYNRQVTKSLLCSTLMHPEMDACMHAFVFFIWAGIWLNLYNLTAPILLTILVAPVMLGWGVRGCWLACIEGWWEVCVGGIFRAMGPTHNSEMNF